MRRVVTYTSLALGVTLAGSVFAGGMPKPECPDLDKKVDKVTSFMKQNNVKFHVAPNQLTDRVKLNGKVNVDGVYIDDAGFRGRTRNYNRDDDGALFVNNANLMTEVDVNKWTTVNMDIAYLNDSIVRENAIAGNRDIDDGSAYQEDADIVFDEVYVTFDHFTGCEPFVVRAGKMYNAFGTRYNPYPMLYTPARLLSQQRTTNLELAYGTHGLYGEAFIARGQSAADRAGNLRLNNGGAKVGFMKSLANADVNVSASYILDVRDSTFLTDTGPTAAGRTTLHKADAISGHGDLEMGPFGLKLNYVTALENVSNNTTRDTRLWGGDIYGDYKFKLGPVYHKLGAGWYVSGNFDNYDRIATGGGGSDVAKHSTYADFTTYFNKNVKTTLLYAHSDDYSGATNGGSSDRVALRAGVTL